MRKPSFVLLLIALVILLSAVAAQQVLGQSDCPTNGPCDLPEIRDEYLLGPLDRKLCIRLYYHILTEDDGSRPTITEEQIADLHGVFNRLYAQAGIEFVHDFDYVNSTEFRTLTALMEGWDEHLALRAQYAVEPEKYCNIFVVLMEMDSYPILPWSFPLDSWQQTGIIMEADQAVRYEGIIAIHEMGHTLGLHHPWNGPPFSSWYGQDVSYYLECAPCWESLGDDGNYVGDFCSDTPPSIGIWRQCDDGPEVVDPCTGIPFEDYALGNVMSYAWDCMSIFTPQQIARMRCWAQHSYPGWLLDFEAMPYSLTSSDEAGSFGVSWVDYDNDGYTDIFVTSAADPDGADNTLYHNDHDGTFSKITGDAIVSDGELSRGCSWGDYNNDGFPDAFVANLDTGPNALYENNGNGTFARLADGVIDADTDSSFSGSWADYDNDGDLDLVVGNAGYNALYRNDGGSFARVDGSAIMADSCDSRGLAWGDYDGDGDLDLFVANLITENNQLFQNNGDGTFTEVTSGTIVTDSGESSGGSWGDYDNDGDLDLFVANRMYQTNGRNFLYNNQGDGTFTKITSGAIVEDEGYSSSSSWGDYDNDGDLDLFVANHSPLSSTPGDFLYENNGDGTFTRITDRDDLATGWGFSYGAAWGDYNNDGALDMALTRFREFDADDILYRNIGFGNHWITIKCVGTTSNVSAIGAKVRVKATIDGAPVWQMREISGQTGFCGQSPLAVHFGLLDAAVIDSLVVEWPSGLVEVGTDVGTNEFLTIDEGVMDPDEDGLVGSFDNCPYDFNPIQSDDDGDGIGDACDVCPFDALNDIDGDEVCGDVDNCPETPNPEQLDPDNDGLGNLCDNCPEDYNPIQEDLDGDGTGDSCEVIRSWYVQPDGTGDAPTIQSAIDSCFHGDTVFVGDGMYTGAGNWDIDILGRRILLQSVNGPDVTVIDCQGSIAEPRRGFVFQNGEDASWVLDGFTILNGYGPLYMGTPSGGGLLCEGSSPTIKNCVFAGNQAILGGAVFLYDASPHLVNCTFIDDSSGYGPAVFAFNHSVPVLENSIIAFNEGSQPVVCMESSSISASCCDVYGNSHGDWVGCLAGQETLAGNFSADPLFCSEVGSTLGTVNEGSPCLPTNNDCDTLIGALGAGCACDCGVWGDVNGDGLVNPMDVVYMVNYVYKFQDARVQPPACPFEAGDVDCNEMVNPVDVVYLVNAVYKSQNAMCDGCNP